MPPDDSERDRLDRLASLALRSLDLIATAGDARARHAAAVLKGERSNGRPPLEDAAALAEVAAGGSLTEVARRLAGGDRKAAATIRHRLARKLGQKVNVHTAADDIR